MKTKEQPKKIMPIAGPYAYCRNKNGTEDTWDIVAHDGRVLATHEFWDDHDGQSEQIKANFRLLAAAPELLKALMSFLLAVDGLPWTLFTGCFSRTRQFAFDAINTALPK